MSFQPLTQQQPTNNSGNGTFQPLSTQPIVRPTATPQPTSKSQVTQQPKPQQNIFQGITSGIGGVFNAIGTGVHNELFGNNAPPQKLSSGQSYSLSEPTVSQPSAQLTNNATKQSTSGNLDKVSQFAQAVVSSTSSTLNDIKNAVAETGQAWMDIPQTLMNPNYKPKDLSPSAQRGLDFIGGALMGGNVDSGAVAGNTKFIAKQALQKATKDVTETPGSKQSFFFSPQQVQQVVIGNNTGMAKDILSSLNLSSTQWKTAVKTGAKVEINSPSVLQIADKPWFAKFKSTLGMNPGEPTSIAFQAKPTISNIAGLLGSGEHTPEDLVNHVLENNAADTQQGKELLKIATDAKTQGKNITIGEEKALATNFRPAKNDIDSQNQQYLQNNLSKAETDYNNRLTERYGRTNIVSADDAKHILPGFEAKLSDDYHGASSAFSKYMYDKMLPEQQGKGNNTVMFMSGGTGAGKTTAIKNAVGNEVLKNTPIIYDTNLSGVEQSSVKIDKALDSGYKVNINYVQRDPIVAFEQGVLPRVRSEGRLINIEDHMRLHDEAFKTLEQLKQKYGDKININYIDNTGSKGQAKLVSFDNLPKFNYNKVELKNTLYEKLEQAVKQGTITKDEASAIRLNEDRASTGAESQPKPQNGKVTSPSNSRPITAQDKLLLDDVREALYSDPEAGRAIYDAHTENGAKFPSFEQVQKEVDLTRERTVNDMKNIQKQLESEKDSGNPDAPNAQIRQMARELADHFSRPGAKYKITGTERTYKSADGRTMLVGGNASQAFDRLYHATDIEGFKKNIQILHEKFDSVFTSMYSRVRSGAIDGANYEHFRQYIQSIEGQRLSSTQGGKTASNKASEQSVLNQTDRQPLLNSTQPKTTENSENGSADNRGNQEPETVNAGTEPASSQNTEPSNGDLGGRISGQPERASQQQTDRTAWNGSVTLGVGIDPGIQKFFEGEIQPAYQAVREVGKEWQAVINPPNVSKQALATSQLIKQAKAHIANYQSVTANKYHSYRKFFNKYGDNQNIANISTYERTGQFAKQPDAGYSKLYHDSLEESYKVLLSAYGKEPESFIENYVRRQFVFGSRADEEKGVSYLTNYSRSLSASKSPMLKRVLDMPLDEGLKNMKDRGIKVKMASTNPEELRQWSLVNAQQALAYRQAWNDAKLSKLISFVRKGDQIPEGLVKLNDRAAQVFAPAELHFPEGKGKNGLTFQDQGYQSAVPMGQYYATPDVARIFNNAISTGLEGSATYKGLRFVSNTLNQFQLGVSAFHLGAVGIDAGVTDLSVGMAHLLQGHPIKGITHMAFGAIPFASFTKDMYHGRSIINDLKTGSPEAQKFIENMLNPAGGRLGLDARYRNKAMENLQHAIHNNNPLGVLTRGALYLPSAIIQTISHPLLGYAVPRVKLGAFMSLAELKLSRLSSDANQAERNRALMSAWQSIDNRMGQLTYDNLGWNKAFKDVLMMSVRSVGWDYGTLGELGGGARDIGKGFILGNTERADTTKLLGKRGITDKAMWGAALVMYAGLLGGVYMYLHTGIWPQELKDYFNPKNGLTDKNGNPDRMRLPTYMKDVFAYTTNPLGTSFDKASPLLNWISAMANNRDYYGNLIRNPNDPIGTQLQQVGAYALKNATPFAVQQAGQSTGGIEQKAEGFFGINKAPQSVIKSDQQKAMDKAYQQIHGLPAPKTPEQQATTNLKAQARQEIQQKGWRNSPAFHQLMQDGTLKTQRQRIQFIQSAKLTTQQRMLQSIPKAQRAQFQHATQ